MAADRTRPNTSGKSVSYGATPTIRPRPRLSRQASVIPSAENDNSPTNEADTTLIEHPIDVQESTDEEDLNQGQTQPSSPSSSTHEAAPSGSQADPALIHDTPPPSDQTTPTIAQNSSSGPSQAIQVGTFLAQLEIRWRETYEELHRLERLESFCTLSRPLQDRNRARRAYLQEQERSLRADIVRFTPLPPLPTDPQIHAYQEALAAFGEVIRQYFAQKPSS
ncbi:MAG: hypothetical protein J3R72DRAFT_421777 [Linnemannia gamsii]|nr:MAG: hypothetical protein J3R72DRAFT_428626 [Linnemannia gamsii]KAK3841876.1 MAG: hypothetical protein J3R72DRAFT_421777 [Linnemannia gamsii]